MFSLNNDLSSFIIKFLLSGPQKLLQIFDNIVEKRKLKLM